MPPKSKKQQQESVAVATSSNNNTTEEIDTINEKENVDENDILIRDQQITITTLKKQLEEITLEKDNIKDENESLKNHIKALSDRSSGIQKERDLLFTSSLRSAALLSIASSTIKNNNDYSTPTRDRINDQEENIKLSFQGEKA